MFLPLIIAAAIFAIGACWMDHADRASNARYAAAAAREMATFRTCRIATYERMIASDATKAADMRAKGLNIIAAHLEAGVSVMRDRVARLQEA